LGDRGDSNTDSRQFPLLSPQGFQQRDWVEQLRIDFHINFLGLLYETDSFTCGGRSLGW
jgi:hypothetical protein